MIGMQVELPSFATLQGLVVRFLAGFEIFVAAPVIVVGVITVHPVGSAADLTLSRMKQEPFVLRLVQLRLHRVHIGVQHDLLGYVQTLLHSFWGVSFWIQALKWGIGGSGIVSMVRTSASGLFRRASRSVTRIPLASLLRASSSIVE